MWKIYNYDDMFPLNTTSLQKVPSVLCVYYGTHMTKVPVYTCEPLQNLSFLCGYREAVAFLDILAPPYDPDVGRDCNYYEKMVGTEHVHIHV